MKTKMTRKERERKARKELIIDVTEKIIEERGYENITMDEIAEKAEMGKGSLYLYFKNKTSIILAICDRGSRILTQSMSKVLTQEITGLEMIEKLGQTYFQFIKDNPLYFNAFSYFEGLMNRDALDESPMAKKCEENAKEAMTFIIRSIQIGMQDGSIDSSYNPKELGLIVWGASKGVVHMAYMKQKEQHMAVLDEVEFSLESLIDTFMQLVGQGMKNTDHQSENV
ncbi:TetR/AcrR family transcriptional regulator [Rhodohalobacter sp. 614A]|uniref:TetR/AcrR family transcriptional regulator n=1 Tax=Rhodohalobacter sp. 614A TaxID=2908649 RepID=UPI001F430152|nr:TetR/AcrR family transcriptional regulator [Rhodohalobacter sp. 614A]